MIHITFSLSLTVDGIRSLCIMIVLTLFHIAYSVGDVYREGCFGVMCRRGGECGDGGVVASRGVGGEGRGGMAWLDVALWVSKAKMGAVAGALGRKA